MTMDVMLQMRLLLLVLANLLFASPALADDQPDCDNAQTQMEMTYCAGKAFEEADNTLNALWSEVARKAKRLDGENADLYAEREVPTSFEALRDAQRAWIEFRDRNCEYEAYEAFGGSMQPMLGSLCLEQLTIERVEHFRRYLGN